jgi:succinyl-CoA synthetase alpha subunit
MAILINKKTKVLLQGITGKMGGLHTRYMLDYGVDLVAGISPGKGGTDVFGVPVYNTVPEALEHTPIDATLVLVPSLAVKNSAIEAIESGIKLAVVITEFVPVHDTAYIKQLAIEHGTRIVGPNTIGVISPGKTKVGIMPGSIYCEGPVGIVGRSGTLIHDLGATLTEMHIGQTTCVGIGGDPIRGMDFIDVLKEFAEDDETKVVVMIGEIGGMGEEQAAAYLEGGYPKPVIAFIAGQTAPTGKQMGHAGAIISAGGGSTESKYSALARANAMVTKTFSELIAAVREELSLPQAQRCLPGAARAAGKVPMAKGQVAGTRK